GDRHRGALNVGRRRRSLVARLAPHVLEGGPGKFRLGTGTAGAARVPFGLRPAVCAVGPGAMPAAASGPVGSPAAAHGGTVYPSPHRCRGEDRWTFPDSYCILCWSCVPVPSKLRHEE